MSNRPTKGGLDLTDARKRRLVDLRGSPPRANGLEAELEGRPLLEGRCEKRMTLTDLVRFEVFQEVFGTR